MAGDAEAAVKPPDAKCMYHCRMLLALTATIVLLIGIAMQVAASASLYGVPLANMCQAYSGSPEISTKESFTELITSVMAQRRACLSKPTQDELMACCLAKTLPGKQWWQSGICAKPWLWKDGKGFSLTNSSGLNLQESMELFTSILGDFIGVDQPFHYGLGNAEFYCKNCPNDFRKNCFFDPPKGEVPVAGAEELCDCPGGKLSEPGQPFWAMSADQAAGKYVLCSDQAKVFRSWIEAIFPAQNGQWQTRHYDLAEKRFAAKCFSRKGQLGYILTVGPALGVIVAFLTVAALFPYCATSGLPSMTFNFILLTISMTLISFWPLTFTGASGLIASYSFCWDIKDSVVVLNASNYARSIAAPVLFTGQPCFDINSEGQKMNNPFVQQLMAYNAGYVSGGTLMIIALVIMLWLLSKHADVVLESKLARPEAGQ